VVAAFVGASLLSQERRAALRELHATMAAERQALTSDVEQLSLKVVDHAIGQLARLLGAATAATILVVCLGVFLVRWCFFRRPLDIRREERLGAGDATAQPPCTSREAHPGSS
jgi:hypothetical protein